VGEEMKTYGFYYLDETPWLFARTRKHTKQTKIYTSNSDGSSNATDSPSSLATVIFHPRRTGRTVAIFHRKWRCNPTNSLLLTGTCVIWTRQRSNKRRRKKIK
jgi:hypothetical protein